MEEIFLVTQSTKESSGRKVVSIEYTVAITPDDAREFAGYGEHPDDLALVLKKVDEFLAGDRKYFQSNFPNKYAVKCEVQRNAMLQIYEIVRTMKEG